MSDVVFFQKADLLTEKLYGRPYFKPVRTGLPLLLCTQMLWWHDKKQRMYKKNLLKMLRSIEAYVKISRAFIAGKNIFFGPKTYIFA